MNAEGLKLPGHLEHAKFIYRGRIRECFQPYLPKDEVMCRWDTVIGDKKIMVQATVSFVDGKEGLNAARKEAIKKLVQLEKSHGVA